MQMHHKINGDQCMDFWDNVSINRQTTGGVNLTPAIAVSVGNNEFVYFLYFATRTPLAPLFWRLDQF